MTSPWSWRSCRGIYEAGARFERNASACDSIGSALLTSIRPRNNDMLPPADSEGSEVGAEEQAHREVVAVDDDLEDWDDPEIKGPGPKVLRDIKTPTAAEIEQHNATHIPAAAWCPYCVQGKMVNPRHRRVDD